MPCNWGLQTKSKLLSFPPFFGWWWHQGGSSLLLLMLLPPRNSTGFFPLKLSLACFVHFCRFSPGTSCLPISLALLLESASRRCMLCFIRLLSSIGSTFKLTKPLFWWFLLLLGSLFLVLLDGWWLFLESRAYFLLLGLLDLWRLFFFQWWSNKWKLN